MEQLLKNNKNSAAIRAAKQLLSRDSRNPEAHYLLGTAYLNDGKAELALMEYKTVNQIGQFDGAVNEKKFRRAMASLYRRFNQTDDALKEYLLLIQKEPDVPEYYLEAAELFEDRKRAGKAVEYYKKVIRLQPGNGQAFLRLGMLFYRGNRHNEALNLLQKAVQYLPDNYDAHYFIGRIQKESRAYVDALDSFEQAARSKAYRIKALVERGACYLETNSIERAVPELERAVKLVERPDSPDVIWAHYLLATAFERSRKIEKAVDHWETIYGVNPGFRDVAEKLGQFQELRQDDHLKEYLTAGREQFQEMCAAVTRAMGLSVHDVSPFEDGCQIVGQESHSQWRNTRAQPRLVRFLRTAELIEESRVRQLHEEMRSQNMSRCALVASAAFSHKAVGYAESRPIELIDKDRLQELLKSAES